MFPRNERQPRPQYPQRAQSANSTKQSCRSHSSSFEADDERSSSADYESMGPDLAEAFRDGPSQYAGEDTRLTSGTELLGWYAYGFAAEVFVLCGIGECLGSYCRLGGLVCRVLVLSCIHLDGATCISGWIEIEPELGEVTGGTLRAIRYLLEHIGELASLDWKSGH